MKKLRKIFTFVLSVMTIISMFGGTSLAASAASYPSLSSSSYCEFTANKKITVYVDANFKTAGTSSPYKKYSAYVSKGDVCYIYKITSSYVQISYPTSTQRRIGYIKTKDLLGKNITPDSSFTASNKVSTYKYKDGASTGYFESGDTVYTVSGTNYNLMYTAKSGKRAYKLAYAKVIRGVTLDSTSLNVIKGKTGTITANLINTGTSKVTAKSSDSSVATVSVSGKKVIIKGIKEGTSTITVTSGSYKATAKVTIKKTCKNCDSYSIEDNILTVNGISMTEYTIKGIYTDSYYANKINRNLGASQCFGYARYIQYKLYGKDSYNNSNNFQKTYYNGKVFTSTTDLKKAIINAGVGAHMRTSTKNGHCAHSMVIIDISENGFTVTDANGSSTHNLIQVKEYTWSSYINGQTSNGAASNYNKRGINYIETYKK